MANKVLCPYCKTDAKLVSGSVIYPRRQDLSFRRFWYCASCQAWTGTHGNSANNAPVGSLANAALRRARQEAHAAFDPLWRSGKMHRKDAYSWLAAWLKIPVKQCHIGYFDEAQCAATVRGVAARNGSDAPAPQRFKPCAKDFQFVEAE